MMVRIILVVLLYCFTIFPAVAQDCTSFLSQANVKSITISGKYIWSTTGGGLVRFDTATHERTWFTKANSGLPVNRLTKIKADQSGNVWMITDNRLVVRYDGSKFEVYDLQKIFNYQIGSDFTDIATIGNKVYISCGRDLLICDNSKWSRVTLDYTGITQGIYIQTMVAYKNLVYLGINTFEPSSQYGVQFVKYDGTTFKLIKSLATSVPDKDDDVTALFTVDGQGNVWAALRSDGITKISISDSSVTNVNIPQEVKSAPTAWLNTIAYRDNTIYCGGTGENGLLMYDIPTSSWFFINNLNSSMEQSQVNSLLPVSAEKVYAGTATNLTEAHVLSLQANVFSLNSTPYDKEYPKISVVGNKLFVSGNNYNGGPDNLVSYDMDTQTWKTYTDIGGLSIQFTKVVKDGKGRLVVATNENIYYLDDSTGLWKPYSEDVIDYVKEVFFDRIGNLWYIQQLYGYNYLFKKDTSGLNYTIRRLSDYILSNTICSSGDYLYTPAEGEGIMKTDIRTNKYTISNTDIYSAPVGTLTSLFVSRDTVYFSNYDYFGKIDTSGQLRYIFTSRFGSAQTGYTFQSPVWYFTSAGADTLGNIWIADNLMNQLYKYNGSDFLKDDMYNSCLSRIQDVYCDSSNRVWVTGDGIYLFGGNYVPAAVSGRQHHSGNVLKIFPNPVTDRLNIAAGADRIEKLTVTDMTGRDVMEVTDFTKGRGEVSIDTGSLTAGVYLLRVGYSHGQYEAKTFVKW